MARKEKIKSFINEYIDIRKSVYAAIQGRNGPLLDELKQSKQLATNKMADFLSIREYKAFLNSFQEIVKDKVPECSSEEMGVYLRNGSQKYFDCLNQQQAALEELAEQLIHPTVTILDLEDGIMSCNGVFVDGSCYPD